MKQPSRIHRSASTCLLVCALACAVGVMPGPLQAQGEKPAELASESAGKPATRLAVLDGEALFERYATDLPPATHEALDRLMASVAPDERLLSIRVIGHADARGSDALNLKLSRERAATIAAALRTRFPDTPIVSLGLGESQPVADNATAAGRDRNRRVEIQMIAIATDPSTDTSTDTR